MCTNVFNGNGTLGTVGGHTNTASNAFAQIFNGFKQNQVAYASTGSYLSYVTPYPYFMRTCADDAFQGVALADIVSDYFGWNIVTVFSTTDTYGSDGITQVWSGHRNIVQYFEFSTMTVSECF